MPARSTCAGAALPAGLRELSKTDIPLLPFGLVGIRALRTLLDPRDADMVKSTGTASPSSVVPLPPLADLLPGLEARLPR
jgi:hypothetical protein